jgi:hypothetical protein
VYKESGSKDLPTGKRKNDKDYETQSSDDSTKLDDTTKAQGKTSPAKKQKKPTLEPTAKKWKERATRAE